MFILRKYISAMKVSGHQIEFGYEAIAAWPYAYWAHTQSLLTQTESGPDTECLYWYSPEHIIRTDERCWDNMKEAKDLPNLWIHKPRLDKSKWVPPPLKERFAPRAITFEKPTVVICNRVNSEWNRGIINYFDLDTLRCLFSMLCPMYSVVYINVLGRPELEDSAKAIDIGDYDMIRKEFPEVRIIHDIIENGSFNETQCRIFAGCGKFISMNGGHSILCSYFGGENIIYSKECKELWPSVNSFFNWYHELGGSHIRLTNDYVSLLSTVKEAWVDERPLLNILVRCHNRPKGIERLWESIESQGYRNVRVIASYDNEDTWKYLHKMPFTKIAVTPVKNPAIPKYSDDYKGFLSPNSYLNDLAALVQDGWVLYMDDDDVYEDGALKRIASEVKEDEITLWRVTARNGQVVPSDATWRTVTAGSISGIGFAFHSKYLPLAQWEPWRRGDYRVIRSLVSALDENWVDAPLSRMAERVDGVKFDAKKGKADMKRVEEDINAKVRSIKEQRKRDMEDENIPISRLRSSWKGVTIPPSRRGAS